jgi:hypothetical protein
MVRLPRWRVSGVGMLKMVVACLLIFASAPTTQAGVASGEADGRLPTATEIFHLRSECAALGRKILDHYSVGIALAKSQLSHYDQKSNRCYVLYTAQTADLSQPRHTVHDTLWDGQTGELLASLQNDEVGHMWGMVYDPQHQPTTYTNGYFDDTKSYIDSLMNEGRR